MRSYRELFLESEYDSQDNDAPSYDDILYLRNTRDPDVEMKEEDEVSEEEYNSYSQEDKDYIHEVRKLAETMDKAGIERIKAKDIPDLTQAKAATITEDDKDLYLVHFYEKKFKWGAKPDREKNFMASRNQERIDEWMPGTFQIFNCDVEVLPTLGQAKEFVGNRMAELKQKTGLTPEDFKQYKGEDLPQDIRKVDPNAIALKYEALEGERGVADSYDARGEQSFYMHDGEVKTPAEWAKKLGMQTQLFRKYLRNGQLSDYKRVNQDGSEYEIDHEWKTITKDERYAYWILKIKKSFIKTPAYGQLVEKIEDADIGITNDAAMRLMQAMADLDVSWTERGDRTREKQEKKRAEREKYRQTRGAVQDVKDEIKDLKNKQDDPYRNDQDDMFDFDDLSDDDIEDAADSEGKRKSRDDMDDDEYADSVYGDDYQDRQHRSSEYYDNSDDDDGYGNRGYVPSWER
jgi:hypothetical protein